MNSQRIENLFRNLQKDPGSVFYSIRTLSKSIINKAHKSSDEKDVVFVNLYKKLEDKNFYQKKEILPLVTPFFNQKSNVDRSTLYSITKPFDLVHGILLIQDFWLNLLLIQNIVFYWLIYLLLKFTFIQ